jgi:hypothetical protein
MMARFEGLAHSLRLAEDLERAEVLLVVEEPERKAS